MIFSSSLQIYIFFCYEIDLIFFFNTNQKPIFLVLKNKYDIFLKPKDFVLFNKHRSDFSMPKTIFFTCTKIDLIFLNQIKKIF